MTKITRLMAAAATAWTALAAGSAGAVTKAPCATASAGAPLAHAPRVQIALLLDTSSSMNGLIDQARSQLWSVVNEFAAARRGRPGGGAAGRPLRIRERPDPGRARLRPPGPALHDRPRPRLRGALRAHHPRGRGVLRARHPDRPRRAALEHVARRPQGRLHRRQRALQPGARGLPARQRARPRARHRRSTRSTAARARSASARAGAKGRAWPTGRSASSTRTGPSPTSPLRRTTRSRA